MSRTLHDAEAALVRRVLRGEVGRRDLFRVSAAGAAAMAGGAAGLGLTGLGGAAGRAAAQDAASPNVKDLSKVMPIGGANATGKWYEFTSFMTPVERFYVRNHYPTPRVEDFPELDPAE